MSITEKLVNKSNIYVKQNEYISEKAPLYVFFSSGYQWKPQLLTLSYGT